MFMFIMSLALSNGREIEIDFSGSEVELSSMIATTAQELLTSPSAASSHELLPSTSAASSREILPSPIAAASREILPSTSATTAREKILPAPSASSARDNVIPAPSADPAPEPFFPVSPETAFFACGSPGELEVSIIRKSPTYICIEFVSPRTFSSGSTSQSVRAMFEPISDLLTSVTVKGSYSIFNKSLESTLIVAGSYLSSSAISSLTGAIPGGAKFYINPERGFIFNLYTIIITVLTGKVTLVTLEEGCSFCQHSHDCTSNAPDSSAYQKSCHLSATDCIDDENGGNACDLRVFIVWQGDDKFHSSFTSAGLRPSRFAMFPVAGQQILDQMKHI